MQFELHEEQPRQGRPLKVHEVHTWLLRHDSESAQSFRSDPLLALDHCELFRWISLRKPEISRPIVVAIEDRGSR